MANFDQALTKLLKKEGGSKLTNTKHDRGGQTKWGISQRAYPHLDIAELDFKTARQIYEQDYWQPLALSTEPSQQKAELLFEAGVHMGVSTAKKLARLVKPQLDAEQSFMLQFKLLCVLRYTEICFKYRQQQKFLLGWLRRVLL